MSDPSSASGAGPAANVADDQGRQPAHVREAEKLQQEIINSMTPGRRLQIAQELYDLAWQLKEAGLRRQHPDWTDDAIRAKCRRVFLTGYAGA